MFMEDLRIEKSPRTPFVSADFSTGTFTFEGRSLPENPEDFYSNIYCSLIEYYKQPCDVTTFNFSFEYINSGSVKALLDFFHLIRSKTRDGHKCLINWHYEEDDKNILELGQYFSSHFKVPFNFIETSFD